MQPLSAHRPKVVLDPSPSRLGYRFQRWWLTPVFRALLRTGVPCAIVFSAVMVYLNDAENRDTLVNAYLDTRAAIQERPEFMVNLMAIEGASEAVAEAIRARLPLDLPQSSFDIDLDSLREHAREVAAVHDASLRIRPGGILEVAIVERTPVLVWRTEAGLSLIDADGVTLSLISTRSVRPDLPLVAGFGANMAVGEAQDILIAASPIASRVRGLVRIGDRRWNLVLDRNQQIYLPQVGAVAALGRAILLDQAKELFARDLTVVDLRNPRRPTLRMGATGTEELRRIRAFELGVRSQ